MRHHKRELLDAALIAAVLVVWLAIVPYRAFAQDPPPECPAVPAAYEPPAGDPPDPVVAELRELRRELAATCARLNATADKPVQIADGQAVDVAAPVELTRGTTAADPLHVTSDVSGDPANGTPENPTYVELAATSAGQVDDAARTLHGDVWLLLGAGAALVLGLPFVRLVTPWW